MYLLKLDFDWTAFGSILTAAVIVVTALAGIIGRWLKMKDDLLGFKYDMKHLEDEVKELRELVRRLEAYYFNNSNE